MSEQEMQAQEMTTSNEPKQVVIEVANPTHEEMTVIAGSIKANYDFAVDVKPVVFNFKKTTDKVTGIETVRKAVNLAIPYPSVDGIVAILETGGKGLELLIEALESTVNSIARDMLADDTSLNAANFPVDKLAWDVIASMPKATRRGGGIPKETWEEFVKDYVEVMPAATGKSVEQCANAAKIMFNKLAQVKTNEAVLQLLIEQLAIYAEATENLEEFEECVAFLVNKADAFLNVSPEELLANL